MFAEGRTSPRTVRMRTPSFAASTADTRGGSTGSTRDGCQPDKQSCDNKWCVNPDHLSLGTDATNAWDKQTKGRASKKLEPGAVLGIKRRFSDGVPIRAIAREFEISQRLVQAIVRGHVWKHISDDLRPFGISEIAALNAALESA